MNQEKYKAISDDLLSWYSKHSRLLPWRNIRNPYATWVSETMLQQTRVETVIPYYTAFMNQFPTLKDLAEAPEDKVLKAWEGLGYYSRARNLLAGARQVMQEYDGCIPEKADELVKLHGIGPYTAGAIASIAFDQPSAAVDGNVIRVISRLFGIRLDVSTQKKLINELADNLVPVFRPGDHNQAMMDLGATICVPGTPDCHRCPLQKHCNAFALGDAADLPILPNAKPPRILLWDLVLIHKEDSWLMRQRNEKLLQGLWCFPMLEGQHESDNLEKLICQKLKIKTAKPDYIRNARHVFTHQVWEMKIWHAHVTRDSGMPDEYLWISADKMRELALPTAIRAAAQICLEAKWK